MVAPKTPPESNYSAKNITVLEGLEAVRKRPGMYIGSTGVVGLHHLIWEVVDNSIDEAMAGYASKIFITLLPDHKVEVRDNVSANGIPNTPKKANAIIPIIKHNITWPRNQYPSLSDTCCDTLKKRWRALGLGIRFASSTKNFLPLISK
jgi:hypothetical protein